MAERTLHYLWDWDLQSSPEALWPLVANTDRFNRDTGMAPVQPAGKSTDPLVQPLQMSMAGMPVTWDEEPFEWLQPHRFGALRNFHRGPMKSLRMEVLLQPLPSGGTHLSYEVWIEPNGLLGRMFVPLAVGRISARRFDQAFRHYDRLAQQGAAWQALGPHPKLADNGALRLAQAGPRLLQAGVPEVLVQRLSDLILQADDLTLARLRPYALADLWGQPRRAVLELCLKATRVGLLNLRWLILCPTCRVPNETPELLSEVRSQIHCDVCGVDYSVNFENSIEVVFRPTPAIRATADDGAYCLGSPQYRPHVVLQQALNGGGRREVALDLAPGRYRLRVAGHPGYQALRIAAAPGIAPGEDAPGVARLTARLDPHGWPAEEHVLAPQATLELVNTTPARQVFILERTAWSDQAATGRDVITLQIFRDLFAGEALRPEEQINVGSLTIVFTDLCDSTRLYRQVGDAPAFGRVMSHFDVLKQAIAAENGSIVKTMGDATLSVFRQPVDALRALHAARAALSSERNPVPLVLKVGLHHGPCIAVNQNERLDYFGSTVNLAARLATLAQGGEMIITAAAAEDPAAAEWLAAHGASAPFPAQLKGFDEPVDIVRLA